MSLTIQIGKGKGDKFSFSVGALSAELSDEHQNMTVKEIANALAKQENITDGEIEIFAIEFNVTKHLE